MQNVMTIVFFACWTCYGQAPGTPPGALNGGSKRPNQLYQQTDAAEFRVQTVRRWIRSNEPLPDRVAQLWRLGDEAAVNVMKIIATDGPLNETQESRALDIIHKAFEHPESIRVPNDLQPNATMFLLQYLDASAPNDDIKMRIAEVRQYAQTAKARIPVPAAQPGQ
jgi:hypothetical protein